MKPQYEAQMNQPTNLRTYPLNPFAYLGLDVVVFEKEENLSTGNFAVNNEEAGFSTELSQ